MTAVADQSNIAPWPAWLWALLALIAVAMLANFVANWRRTGRDIDALFVDSYWHDDANWADIAADGPR
jgi:hypothetical protein